MLIEKLRQKLAEWVGARNLRWYHAGLDKVPVKPGHRLNDPDYEAADELIALLTPRWSSDRKGVSAEIAHREMVFLVAWLRGVLYELRNTAPDPEEIDEVLAITSFDVSPEDEWSRQPEPKVELVNGNALKHGDYIVLDDGEEVMVRETGSGRHKSQLCVKLKGRPPLYVNGYWKPIFRRLCKGPSFGDSPVESTSFPGRH